MKNHTLIISESESNKATLKSKLSSFSLIFLPSQSFTKENIAHLKFAHIIIDEIEGKEESYQIVKKAKALIPSVPILVITNKLNKTHLEKLIHLGVDGFIPMPIAEDIKKILKEGSSYKKSEEIIANIKIPVIEQVSTINDYDVVHYERVKKVRAAFAKSNHISLALIAANEPPKVKDDLLIRITKSLYCIVTLDKDEIALYKNILEIKAGKFYAGIVSNRGKNYGDLAPMLEDAKTALKRAKETPDGISIFTK